MGKQTGKNILVAFGPETIFGTPALANSGKVFRPNPGAGMAMKRAIIRTNEVRSDLKTSMFRLGSKSVQGTYDGEITRSTFNPLIEAVLRGAWAAVVDITQATMTSVTTGANTIVASAGSWLTQGVRVGDIIRATGLPDAANNARNLRVTGVTASTITVAETLIVNAVGDTTFTIEIQRKLVQPTAPVRRSFTFEEYNEDADVSEQAVGVRISSMKVTGQPDGMAMIEFTVVGQNLIPLDAAASPYFTAPTKTSTEALVFADATIRLGGVDIATLTAFEMTLDLKASTQAVLGGLLSPDVYDGAAMLTGTISGTRDDFTQLNAYINETELELHILLVEPTAEPKGFVSFFVPRLKFNSASKSYGNDGALIQTLPWEAGDKEVATGYDDSMLVVETDIA